MTPWGGRAPGADTSHTLWALRGGSDTGLQPQQLVPVTGPRAGSSRAVVLGGALPPCPRFCALRQGRNTHQFAGRNRSTTERGSRRELHRAALERPCRLQLRASLVQDTSDWPEHLYWREAAVR